MLDGVLLPNAQPARTRAHAPGARPRTLALGAPPTISGASRSKRRSGMPSASNSIANSCCCICNPV